MKICLFADAGSVHIRQLSLHLSRRGHKVHIVTHKPAAVSGASVERFVVPPPGLSNLHRWVVRRRRYLSDIFRKFDVVNVQFLADWNLHEILEARGDNDARLVATAWGSDIVDPPGETPATEELTAHRKNLLHMADAITTCGPTFAKMVADFAALSPDAIRVVPFGVDVSLFNPDADNLEQGGMARVGFFKGFRPVYGPTVLMRAMPAVLAECPDTRFEMIGGGAELRKCQAMAQQSRIEHSVDWVERLEHPQLPAYMQRWQLSVIPSLHEAFGVAALESQAMGVPVVASQVDGLQDTVRDGVTGLLLPVGDAEALAYALIRLLRDAKLRRHMSAAGREMVARQYNWRDVAGKWEDLYSRVREQACVMV